MPPKGWKKPQIVEPMTDLTEAPETPEPVVMVATEPVEDAAARLYRDHSGAPRGQSISEGRDNFAAITDHARSLSHE